VSLTDTDLIARVLVDDDRNAFAELVRRHQSVLRGFLRRVTGGDNALADDLAQETCIAAYKNLARFSGASSFGTWLVGIGYNRYRQWCRKKRELPLPDNMPEQADENDAMPGQGMAMDVREAMKHLRDEERVALELCYGQGLSHDEAAVVLGCPIGTLKTHILRAKEQMKIFLSAYSENV
jgi:RNA polymerase sigma-70 factor, ECF subfamily